MKAPSSTMGAAVAGAVAAGAGAGAGYYLGGMAAAKASPNDATALQSGRMAGALLGALVTGFAGVVVAAKDAKWRKAGFGAALMGVGAVTAASLYGTYKQYSAAPAQVGTSGVGRLAGHGYDDGNSNYAGMAGTRDGGEVTTYQGMAGTGGK